MGKIRIQIWIRIRIRSQDTATMIRIHEKNLTHPEHWFFRMAKNETVFYIVLLYGTKNIINAFVQIKTRSMKPYKLLGVLKFVKIFYLDMLNKRKDP